MTIEPTPTLVGRIVRGVYDDKVGEVTRWEPYGSQMCDALVSYRDGTECWHGSSSLVPMDGYGPLPSRTTAQAMAREEQTATLEVVMGKLSEESKRPWPGMEFAKGLAQQMLVTAIADLKEETVPMQAKSAPFTPAKKRGRKKA